MSYKDFLIKKHKDKANFIKKNLTKIEKINFSSFETDFLDLNEQAVLKEITNFYENVILEFEKINIFERKRAIIYKADKENKGFSPVIYYKVKYNSKFNKISHRDIKGVLYNLGVETSKIGDIKENEDEFYFVVLSEVSDYIRLNFKKVKNVDIELEEINNFDIFNKGIEKNIIVSSMRLDVILSSCFNISRGKSKKAIDNKDVKVNHKIIEKSSFVCNNNKVVISFRGFGRCSIKEFIKKTSKGKNVLKVEIFK